MSGEATLVRPSRREIVNAAALVAGMPYEEIVGAKRSVELVRVRWIVCTIAHEFGYSTLRIGAVLNRDHTTVMHSLRRFAADADAKHRQWAAEVRAIVLGDVEAKRRAMAAAAAREEQRRLDEADARGQRLAAAGVDYKDHEGQSEVAFVSKLESTNALFVKLLRKFHPDMETPDHSRVRVKQWRDTERPRAVA